MQGRLVKEPELAAVSQIRIALREHTQQEPTELYSMKLVYEYRRSTKISTKLLFKQKFLVKDGLLLEDRPDDRDLLSGFWGNFWSGIATARHARGSS